MPDPSNDRVLILGASGFIGRTLTNVLKQENFSVCGLSSKEVDLTSQTAAEDVQARLSPTDTVIILAALTPAKGNNSSVFMKNIQIGYNIASSFRKVVPKQIIYISSDAVYDYEHHETIDENTLPAPRCFYGLMHLAREKMFSELQQDALLTIIRPTMIFAEDEAGHVTGPQHFWNAHVEKLDIAGKGEELRDFIWVEDIAHFIKAVILRKKAGLYNLATGDSLSFCDIMMNLQQAGLLKKELGFVPRTKQMTHRRFDSERIKKEFPEFTFYDRWRNAKS